ncbi:MAG: outer membrane beta-barrel protein [Acidobacteriota bacterium]|nr:outer membrane beta-barrel protein [Acidobacteriota bacterium]MDQ7088062.1 outer membrane beta-barrel protein [Acidobacteriota bacterium]
MTGRSKVWLMVILAVLGTWAAAGAQEGTGLEINAGIGYALNSRLFEVEQGTTYGLEVGYRFSPRFSLGLVYDSLSTTSDVNDFSCGPVTPAKAIPEGFVRCQGDVKMTLYGISGIFVFSGEPDFQVLGVVSAGQGKLDYTPPADPIFEIADTDISLWYEIGAGARWALGDHWSLRFLFSLRRVKPKDPNEILSTARTYVSPTLRFGYRF